MNKNNLPKFRDSFLQKLNNNKIFLNEFIDASFEEYNEDNNMETLFESLRYITEAQGGITALAEKTGLSRQTIYNTFSLNGSPKLSSFTKILNVLGFEFKIVPIDQTKKAI